MIYAQHLQVPTKEIRASKRIRQTHRWLSIIFTATVIANFIAMALGEFPAWVVYSPLPPLFLMLFTGLYMFVLPYLPKRRAGAWAAVSEIGGWTRRGGTSSAPDLAAWTNSAAHKRQFQAAGEEMRQACKSAQLEGMSFSATE